MRSPSRCSYRPETIEAIPLWINLFGPCTQIGRALGLAVDLPDLVDRTEPQALLRLPSTTWKDRFEGLVADTMRNGDHGWLRLAVYSFGIAYFDLEEGVKFSSTVAGLKECLTFIVSLSAKEVRLWDVGYMGGWGGGSGSCVWVSQAVLGAVPDAEPVFKEVGLVTSGPSGSLPWLLPPGWEATP